MLIYPSIAATPNTAMFLGGASTAMCLGGASVEHSKVLGATCDVLVLTHAHLQHHYISRSSFAVHFSPPSAP